MKITAEYLHEKWNAFNYYDGGYIQIEVKHALEWHVGYKEIDQKALVIISQNEPELLPSSKSIVVTKGRRTDGLDAVDALVHFLDYCSVSGVVCTEVRALDEGYLLQTSSASPLRLQGVWRISTDVSSYYVNCKTGEITRE